jgi:hypothetical protein
MSGSTFGTKLLLFGKQLVLPELGEPWRSHNLMIRASKNANPLIYMVGLP